MRIAKILILLALPGFVSCQAGFLTAGAPLLLDEYPGAAAAYSVHQLNTAYGGNALRVRRASDNATADIGFDNGELNIGQLINHCSGTNCFVSIWYDQSGNGRNATQTTAGNQPKIYDSSTGIIYENGQPAIDFDGTNNTMNVTSFGISGNTNRGIFCVISADVITMGATPEAIFDIGDGTTNNNGQHWILTSEIAVRVLGGNEVYDQSALNQNLISNTYSGSNVTDSKVFKNGVELSALSSVSKAINTIDTNGYLGFIPAASVLYNGTMQTLIFYASDQTANRVGIETNLNNFFSIY